MQAEHGFLYKPRKALRFVNTFLVIVVPVIIREIRPPRKRLRSKNSRNNNQRVALSRLHERSAFSPSELQA